MGKGHKIGQEILEKCLAGRTRLLNRVVTSAFDEELRVCGLTSNQLTILAIVAFQEEVSPIQLQDYLRMDQSTVSRSLQRMMRNGWLARTLGETRRSYSVVLTPKGQRLLEEALPVWRGAQSKAQKILGPTGISGIRGAADPLVPNPVGADETES